MTVASDLADFQAAVAQISADSEIYTQLVSGPSSGEGSTVETESGTVKTLPRILSELEALYTSFVSDADLPPNSTADGIVTRPVGVLTLLGQILAALASLDITINPGDVQIGAVELKDGATDNRAALSNADVAANSVAYGLIVRVVGLLATLGEVGANPTANTILDRLKALATSTGLTTSTLHDDLAALIVQVGEVHVSPTPNTLLARIKALETALAATLTIQGGGAAGAPAPGVVSVQGIADGRTMKITNAREDGTVLDDTSVIETTPGSPVAPFECVAAPAGVASSVADVEIAPAVIGQRNYLPYITIGHDVLGAVTELRIKDGATIIKRFKLQTPAKEDAPIYFEPPLRSSVGAALNWALGTSVTGGVFVNGGGYTK